MSSVHNVNLFGVFVKPKVHIKKFHIVNRVHMKQIHCGNKYMLIKLLNAILGWKKNHVKQSLKVKVLMDLTNFGVLK